MTAARTRQRAAVALAVATALTLAAAALTGGSGSPAGAGPATSVLAAGDLTPAATSTAVSWTGDLAGQAPCPEGTTRLARLHREGFEVIPQPRFNNGWYRITGVEGNYAARALVDSSDPVDHMFLPYVQGTRDVRTMLAFATRSTQPDSAYTRAQVNSVDLRVSATGSWGGRVYDVTPATRNENGWLGTWFEHRTKSGAQTTWDLDNLQIYTCRNAPVSRIAGSDRYVSASRIADTYPAGVAVAYLATGQNYPDALSASALAGRQGAPVLLTRRDSLPTATRAQLQRLAPQRLVVLGGTGAITTGVEQQAAAYAGTTTRVTGTNRYEVSAALARSYQPGVPVLYVASGADFPDALSIGALAGRQGAPLLITRPHELPAAIEAEVARLNPGRIVVVGGPNAVQDRVLTALRAHTSGTVSRIAGTDRYQVSAAVADQFPGGLGRVYVATGTAFPDALVGAARAGSQGVPVVLSRSHSLPGAARQAIDALDASRGVLLGGQGALSSLVMDQVGARVG
jgi:putative cell wall-binding protein